MTTELPSLFLPYQADWKLDVADVKVAEKSRRVGLSWCEAADATEIAALKPVAGGMDVWYIGYNKDMAQEFIRDVAFWARTMNAVVSDIGEEILSDEDKDILMFVVKFASGHRVTALTSRPSNLRGKQGVVIIDEAAFHDDLPGLLKAAIALLMWGGKVRIISTHNGENNPFNELVQDIRAGKTPYSLHRIDFDSAIKQGLYKRICLSTKKEWTPEGEAAWVKSLRDFYRDDAAEELDVIPSSGSGVYLTRTLIEGVMRTDIPVLRLDKKSEFAELPKAMRESEIDAWCDDHLKPLLDKLDPTLRHFIGEDFGRSSNLTVLAPAAEQKNLDLVVSFMLELFNVPFEQQWQIFRYIVDRLPRFTAGALDARGNGQYLAEVAMQKYGSQRISQVMLSHEWYRDNTPRFKAAFEDKTLFVPRDAHVLTDLRALKLEKGVAKIPDKMPAAASGKKVRHGDSAIALIMLEHAARAMDVVPIESMAQGDVRVSSQLNDYMGDDDVHA